MSEKDINEIIAEEIADVHVYEIRYYGPPWLGSFPTELSHGPDQYDLDDVRILAEDTLSPGQVLKAYEGGRVVARYEADPDTGVVVEVFRLD